MPKDLLEAVGWTEPKDLLAEVENPESGRPSTLELRQAPQERSLFDKARDPYFFPNAVFSMFKDPVKEKAKAVQAIVDSEALDIHPSVAYSFKSALDKYFDIDPERKGKRELTLKAIKAFNDTGAEDEWSTVLLNNAKMVPFQLQVAAGGIIQALEENWDPAEMWGERLSRLPESMREEALRRSAMSLEEKRTRSIGRQIAEAGAKKSQALAPNVMPGSWKELVGEAEQSTLTNIIALVPSLLTGNPIPALAVMGAASGGQTYYAQTEGGSDPKTAGLAAFVNAVSEIATEFIPVGIYLKPKASFVQRLVEAEFAEIPTESVNSIVNSIVDKTTIRKDMTAADALDNLIRTIQVTALSTPGLAGMSHSVNKIVGKTLPDPMRETFNREVNEAINQGATAQEATAQAMKVVAATPKGKAFIDKTITKLRKEAQIEARNIPESDIDEIVDQIPQGEGDIDELTERYFPGVMEDALQEQEGQRNAEGQGQEIETLQEGADTGVPPSPETGESAPSVIDQAKAINDRIGEDGFIDLEPLVTLGRSIWNEGATTLEAFTARAKELLSDSWEKVKDFVMKAWDAVRAFNEELGERGAVNIKGRIRETTGQTKGPKTVREYQALKASMQKAVQAARIAYKQGRTDEAKAAEQEVRTIKQAIAKFTGQRGVDQATVTEYEALKATFKKAAQAGRVAYRAGNTAGVTVAKEQMKKALQRARDLTKEREQKTKDIAKIKKLGEMKGDIAVDYQKKIKALVSGLDFKNITAAKWAELQGLQDFIERQGMPLGIKPGRLAELKRLTQIPLKSLDNEQIAFLRKQLEELTALGKLKAQMKFKYKERQRAVVLGEIISTTKNLDPDVVFDDRGDMRHRDKFKGAAIQMYLDTLHAPRVTDTADGWKKYKGAQTRLIRMAGEGEQDAITKSTKRETDFLQWMTDEGIEMPSDESEVKMAVVMRVREGATTQAQTTMDKNGLTEIPELTVDEERIIEYYRQNMEDEKSGLVATYEEVEGEIFPEQAVYYLPLKYKGDPEIVPDKQTAGTYRTTQTFDGFSHARRPGVKKEPRTDVMNIFHEAIMEQEWYKSIQPVVEDIKSVVLTDEYRDAAGQVLYDWWKDKLDIISRRGWSASAQMKLGAILMQSVRHKINTATLGFRLTTLVMQPFAVFDGMAFVNTMYGPTAAARVLTETTKTLLIPGRAKEIVAESEALKQRQGGELAITEELAKAKGENLKDRATRAAFNLISSADVRTAAGTQEAVRKILIEEGASEDEALSDAELVMHLSQGSSSVSYRPNILAHGEFWRTWFTFQSFIMNRWGMVIHDMVTGSIAKGDFKQKALGVIGLGILMAAGLSEDEARKRIRQMVGAKVKEDKSNIAVRAFGNVAYTMPVFGNIAQSIVEKTDGVPPAMRIGKSAGAGTWQTFTGKDAQSKIRGALKATEAVSMVTLGLPGTSQAFDLLEAAIGQ